MIYLLIIILKNWRAQFQNQIHVNPLVINIIVQNDNDIRASNRQWNLDPHNSRKYFFFFSKFCFPIDICINSLKETCFSQKYQKWICLILELSSSIVDANGLSKIQLDLSYPATSYPDISISRLRSCSVHEFWLYIVCFSFISSQDLAQNKHKVDEFLFYFIPYCPFYMNDNLLQIQ